MPYHPRGQRGERSRRGRGLVFGGFCILDKWMSQSINGDWTLYILKAGVEGVRGNGDLQVSDRYRGQSYCLHASVRINESV